VAKLADDESCLLAARTGCRPEFQSSSDVPFTDGSPTSPAGREEAEKTGEGETIENATDLKPKIQTRIHTLIVERQDLMKKNEKLGIAV
jgi:hypothetical protein